MYEAAVAALMMQCLDDEDESEDDEDEGNNKNRNRARLNSNGQKKKHCREDIVEELNHYITDDALYGSSDKDKNDEAPSVSKLEKMYKLLVPDWIIQSHHAVEMDNYAKKQALANKFAKSAILPVRGRRSSVAVRKEATQALVKDVLQVINEKEETVEEELKALEEEDDRRLKEEKFIEDAQKTMEGYLEKKSPAAHNRYQVCICIFAFYNCSMFSFCRKGISNLSQELFPVQTICRYQLQNIYFRGIIKKMVKSQSQLILIMA